MITRILSTTIYLSSGSTLLKTISKLKHLLKLALIGLFQQKSKRGWEGVWGHKYFFEKKKKRKKTLEFLGTLPLEILDISQFSPLKILQNLVMPVGNFKGKVKNHGPWKSYLLTLTFLTTFLTFNNLEVLFCQPPSPVWIFSGITYNISWFPAVPAAPNRFYYVNFNK